MKVLLVDISGDVPELRKNLTEDAAFSVHTVREIRTASELIQLYEYDCILFKYQELTDNLRPLLTDLYRKSAETGIIILSETLSIADKVQFLNAGADDCLSAPYNTEELKARILAVIRRKKFNTGSSVHIANVVVDLAAQSICVWDKTVLLTRTEYDLFLFLIMNRSSTVSQTKIADYLWGDTAEDKEASNLLIAHIKNLRKKLKQAKAELEIKNVYGIGYTLIEL
ncbi:response regulator transcription factor [Cytophaga hutchinsonii]|uniref:Two-component response regulator n=1 Tax=Cytophaga hutchinsonii (strain ATCC 33406 / DSM 1761 / CIP 103989 / NBRC 15051 / NCIMB 9469 / D465) TaxID=269798 RepID=A0A6N4SSN4_CYTH3|nr:response regulator transcription factor [Cytophaga hutchinsonii]ABG59415.1 two-component response regulator [Cytophaga hutchinsonii ATCC 33406]SFY02033.1 DNA-binding response regulator, OmpR family, contains REC and winged-helix (wHTH) domain [Cytophaga hutchinsonii ATCC 33406]